MRFGELMKAENIMEISRQAEANAVCAFDDDFWISVLPRLRVLETQPEVLLLVKFCIEQGFKAGALTGAAEGVLLAFQEVCKSIRESAERNDHNG